MWFLKRSGFFGAMAIIIGVSASFFACILDDGKPLPRLVIRTVGENGEPFRPDSVTWYRIPFEDPAREYHATCMNKECTRWSVNDTIGGRIYVQAHYTRTTSDPYCWMVANEGEQVDLDSARHQTVKILMEIRMACA